MNSKNCMIFLSPKCNENLSKVCLRSFGLELLIEQKQNDLNSDVYNAGKKLCDLDWFLNL